MMMRYSCAACAAENEVAPPKGYRLVELEDGEDEDEEEGNTAGYVKPYAAEDEDEDEEERLDEDERYGRNPDNDTPYDHRPSGTWDDKKDSGVGRVIDNPHAGRAGRSSDPRKASEAIKVFTSRYGKLLRESRWFKRSKGSAPVVGLPNPAVDVVTGRFGGRR